MKVQSKGYGCVLKRVVLPFRLERAKFIHTSIEKSISNKDSLEFVHVQHWKNKSTQKQYLKSLERKLNITTETDWYSITPTQIREQGGSAFLDLHKGSLRQALTSLFPEYPWKEWKFKEPVEDGFWKDHSNQKRCLDSIASELGITSLDDWYSIQTKDIQERGGTSLLYYYNRSLISALSHVYPEHNWQYWRFSKSPQGYWDRLENQRAFFDWFAKEHGLRDYSDWYRVRAVTVRDKGGAGVLYLYGGSLSKALEAVYSEYQWQFWKCEDMPLSYWKNVNNQKKYFDSLAKELNIKDPEQWYNVTPSQIKENRGSALMKQHNGSLYSALRTAYPDYDWKFWKFSVLPQKAWDLLENQRKYFAWLSAELGVDSHADWNRVTTADINNLDGTMMLKKYGGLEKLLLSFVPSYRWISNLNNAKTQNRISYFITQLFPNTEILSNYRHPELFFSKYTTKMELDIFIPSLSLALEYQGLQHVTPIKAFDKRSSEEYSERDREKKLMCVNRGITLIQIPHWWDRTIESIGATIHQHRPDLLHEYAVYSAIPVQDPQK